MDPSATLFPDAEVREEDDHVSTATGDEGDDCCAICLGTLSDAVALPSCRHVFCLACLLEWSEISLKCPLCKTPFRTCVDVASGVSLHTFFEKPAVSPQPMTSVPSTRRPRSRASFGRRLSDARIVLNRERALERRRQIYATGLYAAPHQANPTGKFRELTPQAFSRSQSRLRTILGPWILRDLQALLPQTDDQGARLILEYILALMQDRDLTSASALLLLEDFLGQKAQHFVHELLSFAKSPLSMDAYDQAVSYAPHSSPQ